MQLETIQRQFSQSLGLQLTLLQRYSTGTNAHTAKVTADNNQCFFVKSSRPERQDTAQRLRHEFASMQFLWDQGIREIPQPLFAHDTELMVYQFVHGKTMQSEQVNVAHIEECCRFYQKLHRLTKLSAAKTLNKAAEACFSLQAYLDNVEQRLTRLQACDNQNCLRFLDENVIPLWSDVKDRILDVATHGIALDSILRDTEKTLSPSDVGLHNMMIEKGSGRIVFFDFEFFGWDDPAKLLADFLLQPAQPLPNKLNPTFIKAFTATLPHVQTLIPRFKLIFCLLGIKWCLIMLNPFLPGRKETLGSSKNTLLRQQLSKAQKQLATVYHYHQSQEFLQWL